MATLASGAGRFIQEGGYTYCTDVTRESVICVCCCMLVVRYLKTSLSRHALASFACVARVRVARIVDVGR